MMSYILSVSISIFLSGYPLNPMRMEKSLRQGDPLSPYLFIRVSEALVFLLKKVERLGVVTLTMISEH